MKHVIVIETTDDPITSLDALDMQKFQKQCYEVVEMITEHYYGECFVRSSFFQHSAIKAVAKMYDVHYEPKTGQFN